MARTVIVRFKNRAEHVFMGERISDLCLSMAEGSVRIQETTAEKETVTYLPLSGIEEIVVETER